MALVPIAALWALCPLLARTDPVPVTVTAALGQDACLPCGSQPWAALRGVTLSCSHQAGGHRAVPVLRHRLGWQPPPPEPGWQPPEQPEGRFRGRVAFCAAGTGEAGLRLLLRNLSQPDFGNYSCYAARAAAPQLLCSLVLRPEGAEVPEEPDMLTVICVLTAAFTAVAIGVVACARCQGHCWGRAARGPQPGAEAAGDGAEVALGDLKSPNT